MKRVLTYGLSNTRGGIENYLMSMQEQLKDEVSFVFLMERCHCIYQDTVEQNGGRLFYFDHAGSMLQRLSCFKRMLKRFREEIDLLYVNVSDISYQTLAVILLGLKYHYKVIVHSHNAFLEPIPSRLHRLTHSVIERICVQACKREAVTCMAVSDRAGRYLFKNGKYDVVHAGIDVKQFLFDAAKRETIREQYHVSDAILYGFVGRLVEIKNPHFVLDVFHEILRQNTKQECKLMFIGDGPMRLELEQEAAQKGIADKVIFIGEVTNVADYLNAIDFMMLPSLSEGLSLVLVEAQASGVPCICSEGRIPKDVGVTPLVEFANLEKGKEFWARRCIERAELYRENDRKRYNAIVYQTDFELCKAAAILKSKL